MKKIVILFFVFGTFVACKNTGTKQPVGESVNPKLAEFHLKAQEEFSNPSKPSQIAWLLELSGAEFMPQLMNDPENWVTYANDTVVAAANLGVYMADAIYQYAYDSIKLAYKSSMAAKSLASGIGIDEEFFMGFIKDRFAEEGGQSDSLFLKLDDALIEAGSQLNANERFRLYAALFAGNYIEKQYLLFSVIFDYPIKDMPEDAKLQLLRDMLVVLGHNLQRLEYIIEMVETAETVDDPGYLSTELKKLKENFASLQLSQEVVATMTAPMIFENETLLKMYEQVKAMRAFIVTQ